MAEHLPQELGDRLVAFVAGLAPIIVFSAAQPGQGGLAHINEQPLAYWRDRFAESGCQFDPDLTEQYRVSVKNHGADEIWLLSNVQPSREAEEPHNGHESLKSERCFQAWLTFNARRFDARGGKRAGSIA